MAIRDEKNSRRNVGFIMHPTGKAALFIYCEIETADRKQRMRWDAHVHPEQVDNLISCLRTARANLRKIGVER